MIVYIDSNVVLEIVMDQPQSLSAQGLIEKAKMGECEIRLPVFVLYEIENRLRRLSAVRQDLAVLFEDHAQTLGIANREIASEGKRAASALADSFLSEDQTLQVAKIIVLAPLMKVAKPLPMTLSVFERALRLTNEEANLHLQDAIVVASVLEDALPDRTPSALITKDTGIRRDPLASQMLADAGCKTIGSIRGGLDYVTHNV